MAPPTLSPGSRHNGGDGNVPYTCQTLARCGVGGMGKGGGGGGGGGGRLGPLLLSRASEEPLILEEYR